MCARACVFVYVSCVRVSCVCLSMCLSVVRLKRTLVGFYCFSTTHPAYLARPPTRSLQSSRPGLRCGPFASTKVVSFSLVSVFPVALLSRLCSLFLSALPSLGQIFYIPNHLLATKTIVNIQRTADQWHEFRIQVCLCACLLCIVTTTTLQEYMQ